jgi:peptidoglycan hydrolase CwlO-like protein|mmetsp:Transcript_44688/g.70758  ORF Transcript_44688/g.70758 Transcript_44688/m.70758 type:complete len:707 (+) Transcript_44688:56-2176(+)|eukprot:CAMPEP_0169096252 /NCGR_PEP_ID=MMETSP1015-20121227/18898_1 /TAXON_ID=342587 /ORGANISM="Karlodinium micrum, Strain CCMP2283" /LENGTH=706 /DNA_ID=CAMNT_0009157001 /DNA_START=49 /DNA_END=2169 /DNA_ORIENTATION=+
MKAATCTLFLFAVSCRAIADEGRSNPLGTVLELMSALEAKITKEGEAEAKAFKDFFEWCDDASKNINNEITTGKAQQAKLEAKIGQLTSAIDTSDTNIESLAGSISSAESELKEATAIRTTEAADFAASEKELVDTVDTLDRAISILSTEMAKNPAAFAQIDTSSMANLVQSLSVVVDAAGFSTSDRQKLVALVQSKQGDEDNEVGAPAAAVYKSHSSGIIDTLEDLKEKAESELADARKAETSAKHNYGMMKQSLDDQMAADTKDLNEEKAAKAASEEAKATAEGDLSTTISDLKNSENALSTANSDCMTTAADHEATVAARTEELKVIATAKKILQGTTSGAVEQTYSFLQIASSSKATSTLHTRADLANSEVVNLVKKLARQHHSAALAQLASRIAVVVKYGGRDGADPFTKVKGLISDMIAKLEKEAESEATEKAYCDEQIAKTEAKKSDLESDIAKLTSKIDTAAAKATQLKEEVKELQAELASLAKMQAEMDNIRAETHAAYSTAKAELTEGLTGVRKALSVLRDYYGGAAAAMLQQNRQVMEQPAKPEMHEKASGAGGSIIDILEVCESDFATNLAKEETEEADAQSEYEKTTQENKVTTAMKEQDVKYKTQEAVSLDKAISEFASDRDTTSSELSAVMDYYGKIKERCIAKPETYEERRARREAEINGLKDALSILESEAAFLQRGKRMRGSRSVGSM